MGIPDHLTSLLRNLYAGQEARVRIGCGTTEWFQIRKGVYQGCILTPCLFNIYADYILRNARLDDSGIKITGRNITNLRYADDTTLMAESEKELQCLLMRMKKESEKSHLNHNIKKKKKSKDHGIWFHHFMANRRGKSRSSDRFSFLGLPNHYGQ